MRHPSTADSHNGKRAATCTVLTQKMLLAPGKGRLSYDVMAKLALAAAEEHVRCPMDSSGIVTLYAKVACTLYHPCIIGLAAASLACKACKGIHWQEWGDQSGCKPALLLQHTGGSHGI